MCRMGVVETPRHPPKMDRIVDMEVNTPQPHTYPPKWIGLEKTAEKCSAPPLLPKEPQHHEVFHQTLNVEPQWACIFLWLPGA